MPIEARRLLGVLCGGYLLLCMALGVIQFGYGDALAGDPRNPRLLVPEPATRRGGILARNGEVISSGPGPMAREYKVASLCHTVGYADPRFGASGLEAAFDTALAGRNPRSAWHAWLSEARGEHRRGADLLTTIDLDLQAAAAGALGQRRGAVVVLDAVDGDVLALVSQPVFRIPPSLGSWARDRARTDAPFLNRALQGLYPPGSVFKIVTAAAALRAGLGGLAVDCGGAIVQDGRRINEAGQKRHGRVDLRRALALSCNVFFTRLGAGVGAVPLTSQARALGLGAAPPFALGTTSGSFPRPRSRAELAEVSIGQGRTLVSPLQMALIACAVANDGVIPRPRLVRAVNYSARDRDEDRPRVWRRALRPDHARILRDDLVAAVRQGTGRAAAVEGLTVGGKTGTAEAPGGPPHAWFVGFAIIRERKLAIAVVVEHGGSGGTVAAPIAAAVWRATAGGATR